MPLYEYQCDACGCRFELIRRFSDPPLESCPTCGGTVQKLASSPAIQFKGTGWYITDYAKKSGGDGDGSKSETKTTSPDGKSGSGEKSGSDEKSAPKTDTTSTSSTSTPAASTASSTGTSSKNS